MNVYTLDKILSILGDIRLQSITPQTIGKFVAGISNLSNAVKLMRLTHFKARINEAIKSGLVKHPFLYTKMPKPAIELLDITVEEFNRIRFLETKHKVLNLASHPPWHSYNSVCKSPSGY